MRISLFFALLFIISLTCSHNENQQYAAPDFILPDVYGININLYSLLDHGPVVLVPWALWCKITIKELDALKPYTDTLDLMDCQILAISLDKSFASSHVLPFAISHDWLNHYHILLDTASTIRDLYDIQAIPSTIAIDTHGDIVFRYIGYSDGDEITIVDSLKAIFGN